MDIDPRAPRTIKEAMMDQLTPEQAFASLHHVLATIVDITVQIPAEVLGDAMVFIENATPVSDDERLERDVYLDIMKMMCGIKQAI